MVCKVYLEKLEEFVKYFGVFKDYLLRKIQVGIWDVKEFDQFVEFFNMWFGDFVLGLEDEKMEQEKL